MSIADCMLRAARLGLLLGVAASLSLTAARSSAQQNAPEPGDDTRLTLDTQAVAPLRFIAAHGRRALVDGYAADGLEVWVYPFQILSGYRVAFRSHGATTPIRGEEILSRVTYQPDSITRTYLGPDFMVREELFVPLDEPGAILTYRVAVSYTHLHPPAQDW